MGSCKSSATVCILQIAIGLCCFINHCHGNSVPYRHEPKKDIKKISVDKIVTLESSDHVVKIGIENVPHGEKRDANVDEAIEDNEVELVNTSDLDENRGTGYNPELMNMIQELKKEVQGLQLSQEFDR